MHAAALVRKLKQRDPGLRVSGIGGSALREAGMEITVDAANLAVVGIIEVITHWRAISAALDAMRRVLREEKPDLLVLVDYAEFNLKLAQTAKECGVPVLFYISPQVWAWRQKRVEKIRDRVDMMAVVFPFEAEFYRKHDVPVRFVGHPLLHAIEPQQPDTSSTTDRPRTVGLFPGSRKSEIRRLLPTILDAAAILREQEPELRFVLPVASTLREQDLTEAAGRTLPDWITLMDGTAREAIVQSDVVITASGTATLEIALYGKPMVIVYRVAPLTYAIVSRLLKIDHIGLCNIVAGERVVSELLQKEANPRRIADEIRRYLDEPEYYAETQKKLHTIRALLGEEKIDVELDELVFEMLGKTARA
ncbi:MAG TPA: lipid-A-disaccharide synthase [Gammaproteobacteria bacterium]|nr:lipid-A-disaccharide synthase [Gammaproteobacteria bacterium]